MSTPRKHSTNFDEFVSNSQNEGEAATAVSWTEELEEWLRHLNDLYELVEGYLKPYVNGGTIAINYRNISLNEEYVGHYEARQMLVKIGRQEVVFTPVGTVLIGTKGRVDVEGAAGRARLVLADRDATRPQIKVTVDRGNGPNNDSLHLQPILNWAWKIATNPPRVSYVDLTKETLFDLVMEVANG